VDQDPYRSPTSAPSPSRGRRFWGWTAAGVAWTLLSVAALGLLAAKVAQPLVSALAADASSSPARSARTTASPTTPSDPVTELTVSSVSSPLPSVGVTGVDPRPAAAAAWNRAMPFYGTSDMTHYCRIFALGPRYMYLTLKDCIDTNGPEAAKLSASDRAVAGDIRIRPEAMVVLADHSIAFRESDQTWPGHSDWTIDDQSVIVMRNVPHQGWRQVGYLDANHPSDSFGYLPAGLT